jgi:hypothetical protein
MNATLFVAIVLHCTGVDVCLRKALDCIVTAGAYDVTEKKAVRIVGDCLAPVKKTGRVLH